MHNVTILVYSLSKWLKIEDRIDVYLFQKSYDLWKGCPSNNERYTVFVYIMILWD